MQGRKLWKSPILVSDVERIDVCLQWGSFDRALQCSKFAGDRLYEH